MQVHYKSFRSLGLFAAAAAILLSAQLASAMRLARYQVMLDGKPVLQAGGGDNGGDADAIWRKLKGLKLQPVQGFKVVADRADPLRATLKGKVVIQELYGGRAESDELQLVRDQKEAQWTIAPAEVDRTLARRHKPYRFSIAIDGQAVLWTDLKSSPGDDNENAESVWSNLKTLELRPINRYNLDADAADPLRATMKGKLTIHEYYAGTTAAKPISRS
jgi:hypothetical protein